MSKSAPSQSPEPLYDILPKMTEQKLKDYFENKITIDELKSNVKNSQTKTGFDTTSVYIEQIKEGEFGSVPKFGD